MIAQIGETAGAVWNYLKDQPSARPPEMAKALKRDPSIVWMAIGWLAREGKLNFTEGGKPLEVSLAPHERAL